LILFNFGEFLVAFVAETCEVLGSNEEFFCFLGEGLGEGVVTYLAHDELTELGEVGFCAVEMEAVLTCFFLFGVEVPEVPVTASNSHLLFVLGATHTDLDTVVDTGSVADDERRTMISFSFFDDLEVLSLACTHSYLGNVDVAVALGDHTEVFLADLLTAGSELGNSTCGGSLRGLSTSVGVNLGVNNNDVYIFAGSEYVVETTESDVVTPAVAAEDPLALLDHELLELDELLADVAAASFHHRNELVGDLFGLEGVLAVVDPLGEEGLHLSGAAAALEAFAHNALDAVAHLAGSGSHTEAELGVVLEQRVSPSGTEAATIVAAVRSSGSGTTIDGGATGSVSNHHLLTEELGDSLEVRSLTATCASAGEFEERLCELAVLNVGLLIDEVVLIGNFLLAVFPVLGFEELAFEGLHDESFLFSGTYVGAVAATGAVHSANLHAEMHTCHLLGSLHDNGLHACGSVLLLVVGHNNGTDSCVGANEGALVTLDTVLGVPCGDLNGNTAFLVLGSTCGESTVFPAEECGYGEVVTALGNHRTHNLGDELGVGVEVGNCEIGGAGEVCPFCGDVDLNDLATTVNSLVVLVNYVFTLAAIRLHDEFLQSLGDLSVILRRNEVKIVTLILNYNQFLSHHQLKFRQGL